MTARNNSYKNLQVRYLCLALLLALFYGSVTAQQSDQPGISFIVDVQLLPSDGADMIADTVKILESRLKGLGVRSKISIVKGRQNRLDVRIYSNRDSVRLRDLFSNRKLEMREVVSPPNPHPYKSFPTIADAAKSLSRDEEVKPYQRRENEDEHFVILRLGAIVSGEQVKAASAFSRTGFESDYQVSFSLEPRGAAALGRWTEQNINRYIAIVLDGQIISISYIKSRIDDQGEISGQFSKAEAELIATTLQSGALPRTLRIVEERDLKNS